MTDLLDPELHASGEAMRHLRDLRARSPVAWCTGRRGPGYWSITGYPELVEAARDTATFSSHWGTRPEAFRRPGSYRPLHNLDPPAHTALRSRAHTSITSDRLEALTPAIESIVTSTFDALARRGGGDAVRDLAEPIVARVFAAWLAGDDAADHFGAAKRDAAAPIAPDALAIPPDALLDRVLAVHRAGAAVLDAHRDDPALAAHAASAAAATRALHELVRSARDTHVPAAGGIDRDDVRRGDADLVSEDIAIATLFVEAGVPTTIDAITSAVDELLAHPDTPIDDPAIAVEELLRRASPIAQFARRATRNLDFHGASIIEGDQVVVWFVAANHDDRVFAEPDAFRPRRAPNPHVAFGVGPHRCIGAAFARRILRTTLRAFLSHRVARAGACIRRASNFQRGFLELPIALPR